MPPSSPLLPPMTSPPGARAPSTSAPAAPAAQAVAWLHTARFLTTVKDRLEDGAFESDLGL